MTREPIRSSNIESIGYDAEAGRLEIEFRGGRVYEYVDVPIEVFDELMSSKSKGSYVNKYIAPVYAHQKI